MADIRGTGGQPAVTNGFSSSTTRPTAPPAQTGSPSGIKGPRMIMQERQERERQRAERAAERERLENEAREQEDQQRRMAERRAPAAGAATGSDTSVPRPLDPASAQRRQQQQQQQQTIPPQAQQPAPRMQQPTQNQQRLSRNNSTQAQQPLQYSGVPTVGGAGGQMPNATGTQPADPAATAKTQQPRNTFPHAFERWEALSAHWEGLTSFWIRKLQQHADEIDRDPVSSQLSRQVSDLSAAGANLFHAVVELQRLRASSERKFQRWFFETRAELERNEETKAALERALAEERMSKANAIQEALENDRNNSKTQKRIAEMQKELLISKEEARRAWEELGRREQEERDRTASLQQGLPTIVGGVQVVPMTQGVPGRGGSMREPRQTQQPETPTQQYQYTQPPQAPATATPSSGGGGYYQQPPQSAGEEERPYSAGGGGSEGAYSEEEYETPAAQPGVSYPPSSSPWSGSYPGQQPDYSGGGYDAPGWETMPRHHHPTRLSDVLEEDETRSRTSAGQFQASRV